MQTPILEITSTEKASGPPILIDGERFHLRTPADLDFNALREIERIAPEIGRLMAQPKLTAKDNAQLEQLLSRGVALAVAAPPAVLARISLLDRAAIFGVFSELVTTATLARVHSIQGVAAATSQPAKTGKRRK